MEVLAAVAAVVVLQQVHRIVNPKKVCLKVNTVLKLHKLKIPYTLEGDGFLRRYVSAENMEVYLPLQVICKLYFCLFTILINNRMCS